MTKDSDTKSNIDANPGFFDLTPDNLRDLFEKWNEPNYRVKQVMEWVYLHSVDQYEHMTNLPKNLRERLQQELTLYDSSIIQEQHSSDGTIKCLLQWSDSSTSECVMIPDDQRRTACISTQVGCPVGCVFCASGLNGLEKQLTAGKIVEQAMRIRALCSEDRLSNVVFMGLGEPLANYNATVHALRTINAPWGMEIAARKITISTVGLADQIRRLATEGLQITLALSLHAPNDQLRKELIPWAENVSIDLLIDAVNEYFKQTGREITLEYILLADVNDSKEQAVELAKVARRMRSNINLITYNPVDGLVYRRPEDSTARQFLATLRDRGINAHLRRSRGLDIDAACGQLRRRVSEDKPIHLSS